MLNSPHPTRSQLLPLLTKYRELPTKSQLIPALLTIVVIMLLFTFAGERAPIVVARGKNPMNWFYSSHYILILGTFLVFISLNFLYSLAGKAKSWLGLIGVMLFTMGFMHYGGFDLIYPLFHNVLAGGEISEKDTLGVELWKHFAGTGFLEELTKAIPLLLLVAFSSKMTVDQQRKYGIQEPLDGILLGAASAGGFVLIETLGQYVPNFLARTWVSFAMNVGHAPEPKSIGDIANMIGFGMKYMGTAPGLELLIPRGLRACFGHMAYSGYLGYFIGLAVLKPQKRWRILGIGYVSASFVHALWDTIPGDLVKIGIAVLCYAVLMAAILKARELSPNRALLAPSVLFGYSAQGAGTQAPPPPPPAPPAAQAPPAPVPQAQPQQPFTAPMMAQMAIAGGGGAMIPVPATPPQPATTAPMTVMTPVLRIGAQKFAITPGLLISEANAPGLQAQSPGGPVAQVIHNPNDPAILGLTNLSRTAWQVLSPSGNTHTIQPWQTVRLARGTRIQFGPMDGEVQ